MHPSCLLYVHSVRAEAGGAEIIKRINGFHILLIYLKIKDFRIFHNTGGRHGFGQGQCFMLQAPADTQLGHGFAISCRDSSKAGMIQHFSASQRAPCFHEYAVVPAELHGFLLKHTGMEFDLIHHGHNLCFHQSCQMMGHEVGYADGPDLSRFIKLRHCLPCGKIQFLPVITSGGRCGPVDQIQVQIIQLQVRKSFIKSRHRFLISPFRVPQLAGDKQFLPGNAAFRDSPSHACFRDGLSSVFVKFSHKFCKNSMQTNTVNRLYPYTAHTHNTKFCINCCTCYKKFT